MDASGVILVGAEYHLVFAPVADKFEIAAPGQKIWLVDPVGVDVLFKVTKTSKRVCDSQALTVCEA